MGGNAPFQILVFMVIGTVFQAVVRLTVRGLFQARPRRPPMNLLSYAIGATAIAIMFLFVWAFAADSGRTSGIMFSISLGIGMWSKLILTNVVTALLMIRRCKKQAKVFRHMWPSPPVGMDEVSDASSDADYDSELAKEHAMVVTGEAGGDEDTDQRRASIWLEDYEMDEFDDLNGEEWRPAPKKEAKVVEEKKVKGQKKDEKAKTDGKKSAVKQVAVVKKVADDISKKVANAKVKLKKDAKEDKRGDKKEDRVKKGKEDK